MNGLDRGIMAGSIFLHFALKIYDLQSCTCGQLAEDVQIPLSINMTNPNSLSVKRCMVYIRTVLWYCWSEALLNRPYLYGSEDVL